MMEEDYDREFLELLAHKYKAGLLTEEEAAYFEKWYNNHQDEQLELPASYSPNLLVIRDRVHAALIREITEGRNQRRRYRIPVLWQKIIAAASIVLIATLLIYGHYKRSKVAHIPDSIKITLNAAPGTNKAILVLSDGCRMPAKDSLPSSRA